MNVVIIGYGKMGHEIEKLLVERGHTVVLALDEHNAKELNADNLRAKRADVAIEFSTMQTAFHNISTCLNAGVAVVSGTTGWLEKMGQAVELCKECGGAFFYASNYSVGVNVMFRVNEALAKMMNRFEEYDVTVEEVHHTHKKDAPGGTAITMAEEIVANLERKKKWVNETTTTPEELEVLAIRRSTVTGTHTVTYESESDYITVTHSAKTRRGFAMGAVLAAEFLRGKKGVFSMGDMLGF